VKKFVVKPFFVATKFTKLVNKIRANFQKVLDFLCKKLSLSSQKYGFGIRDPRSGIRKKTYSGSRIRVQGSKRPRIRICNIGFSLWNADLLVPAVIIILIRRREGGIGEGGTRGGGIAEGVIGEGGFEGIILFFCLT
jgi:hypothetical protein